MSLVQKVADAIVARGEASLDDLEPLFPKYTRKQVRAAIQNAKYYRLISLIERGQSYGNRGGFAPGTYGPYRDPEAPRTNGIGAVSSVFELGDRAAGASTLYDWMRFATSAPQG